MANHVLMKYATRRPYCAAPEMAGGVQYDSVKGYWTKDSTPMVASEGFSEGGYGSKKCDQETGEDQKGE